MSTPGAKAAWTEENQGVLVAEFARLRALVSGEDTSEADALARSARAALAEPTAIEHLVLTFGLSGFERDLLLLCAGVEMDSQLAEACARAPGARGKNGVTFGLALSTLPDAHWSAIAPVRPLRLWRLIELKDDQALAQCRLALDERILHYLVGINYLDPRLRPLLKPPAALPALASAHERIVEAVVAALTAAGGQHPVIELVGTDPAGKRGVAAHVAERLGLVLHELRSSSIPSGPHELEALATLWYREAALLGSALLVSDDGAEATAAAARLVERRGGIVMLATQRAVALDRPSRSFTVDKPNAADQKSLWLSALGSAAAGLNGAVDRVASQFRLSADTIASTASALRGSELSAAELWRACRASLPHRLDDLAQRIDSAATWDDLVLAEPHRSTLRQIGAQLEHRVQVHDRWGFGARGARGLGLSALFAGESGTGKTLAAEVLANYLSLDLYRIDLASTVSKYIGETEKNLSRLFDAAEDSGAILLFDEADALFGKRSEVRDSHDRYANIEVSYLLQRMEAYRGLAILTTNLKSALDVAFSRRLRFVVQFSFPDQAQREQIWRRSFPKSTPLGDVDFSKLSRLALAGGSIRNITLNAAFLAADAGEPISMAHLVRAVQSEAGKRDLPLSEAELRTLA